MESEEAREDEGGENREQGPPGPSEYEKTESLCKGDHLGNLICEFPGHPHLLTLIDRGATFLVGQE